MTQESLKTPAISVIVPVYNGLPHLRETVDALLTQSFDDFELLLCNDGSTDGSLDYLHSLRDPRVRVIDQRNRGLCNTLNRLIEEARAPVIARSDQDDISLPHRLETQYRALQEGGWDFLFSMIEKFGENGSWSNRDQEQERKNSTAALSGLDHGAKLHSTLMARAEAWRDIAYRSAFYPCDDWDLQLRAEEKYRVGILEERLVRYRFHGGAATKGTFQIMQDRSRWAEACALARRANHEEPSEAEFAAAQNAQPRWRRVNRRRKDFHRWAQRSGGEAWLDGQRFRAAGLLALALVSGPERIAPRLWRIVRR